MGGWMSMQLEVSRISHPRPAVWCRRVEYAEFVMEAVASLSMKTYRTSWSPAHIMIIVTSTLPSLSDWNTKIELVV